MQRCIKHIVLLLALATCLPWPLSLEGKDNYDIYDLSLDENLETPEIKNDKQADKIQDFQYDMAVAFKKSNYEVEVMRDNEVIVVTIPASELFDANDTVLTSIGEERLKPFLRMIKNPGFYKMLLVMHSDNTGSETYTLNLTRQRVNAIFDWFDENGSVMGCPSFGDISFILSSTTESFVSSGIPSVESKASSPLPNPLLIPLPNSLVFLDDAAILIPF